MLIKKKTNLGLKYYYENKHITKLTITISYLVSNAFYFCIIQEAQYLHMSCTKDDNSNYLFILNHPIKRFRNIYCLFKTKLN